MRHMITVIRSDSSGRQARAWGMPFLAARMEVARIVTLGLAGFDATRSQDGIRESAEALRGVADGLRAYQAVMSRRDPDGWTNLVRVLDLGIGALESSPEFRS